MYMGIVAMFIVEKYPLIIEDFQFHARCSSSVVFLSCVHFICDCQFVRLSFLS